MALPVMNSRVNGIGKVVAHARVCTGSAPATPATSQAIDEPDVVIGLVTDGAHSLIIARFPTMADDLGTDAASIQLTLTTFMAGLAIGQLVIGPLSDRWGRRRPLLIGAALCVVTSALCAVAPNVGALIAFRFLQGFAGAAGVVLGRAIVADTVRGAAAARIFSILMTIGGIAPVVAPLLGGTLRIESTRGSGTRVWAEIPLSPPSDDEA